MKKSKAILQIIQEQLELGNTLTAICRSKDMPNLATIYKWMNVDKELKENILDARRIGAMTWLDKMQDLLDQDLQPSQVNWAREKLHHARWMASKLVSIFNDKVINENIGEPHIKIVWDDGYSEHKGKGSTHTSRGTDNQDKDKKPNDQVKDQKITIN